MVRQHGMPMSLETPVVFLIFKRPELTERVFAEIAKARPKRLFVVADAALQLVMEFEETVCVAIKHTNPCGVAVARTPLEAFVKARSCDPVSIFGGIIGFNREVDEETAAAIMQYHSQHAELNL